MNSKLPSKAAVERLRKQYPQGTRIELVQMDDPYSSLRPGDRGTVDFIDDTGTVFCRWDNGSGLGLVYGADRFKKTDEPFRFEDGAHFWQHTVSQHGEAEAVTICGNYLKAQLRAEDEGERQFCSELFAAMYEATAGRLDPAKVVYPYDFELAKGRMEESHYHQSRQLNNDCAKSIDDAIHRSCYKPNYYNLEQGARVAVQEYGFERVRMVLASHMQKHTYDGRLSDKNKSWAENYELPGKSFENARLAAHPVLIEDFTKYVNKLYAEVEADRFALPGRNEHDAAVQGYEIVRSIQFSDERGFAIGHNPEAVSPWVSWQFTTENGKRDFYWGSYSDSEKAAGANYAWRAALHMKSEPGVREVENPIAAVELSTEQNANMIDGLRNNLAAPKADLTDRQTHEEIKELASETLEREEKPSVMAKLREARKNPPPQKEKSERQHKRGELER
jgi:hypothetical protein